jgi:hypothetical protein
MNKSRAEITAELQDVGAPPGRELEYQVVSAVVEAAGCVYVEHLPECPEAYLAVFRLRESLFWARRAMGREHLRGVAGLEEVVASLREGAMPEGLE